MKRIVTTTVAALCLLLPTLCFAARCNVTATPVSFGSYDPLSTVPLDSTGKISVTCRNPPQQPLTVTIQFNEGGSANFSQRSMIPLSGGTDRLLYNLFTNASTSVIFGDGSGGSATLSRTIDRNTPWSVTVYGRMPPLQNVSAGAYSDNLTVTILF